MRTSKIAMLTTVLLGLAIMTPFAPNAHAVSLSSPKWLNTTFSGTDPFYGVTVSGYKAGNTATLAITVSNSFASNYINITGAKLMMDWNGNYTGGMTPTNPQ